MNIRELLIKVGFDSGTTAPEIDKIDKKTDKLKANFASLGGILTAVFAGGAIKSLIATGDAMQNLQAQVGNSTGDLANANAQLNELAKHANDTRTSVEAYTGSWAKMNQGIERFGGTTEDTTKFVDTLSAAFAVNGTESASANAALFQLSQTMQSGVVQGEEMNSFLDAQGTLANEVMTAIGGTVAGYKKMQAAGKVTAQMLMDAVNKQYPKYIAQLKAMPMTLGNVWTIVTNDIKVAIGNINDEAKLIPRAAKFLMDTWDKLKKSTLELTDRMGGLQNVLESLARMATPMAGLIAVLAGFKALSMLTTPIGLVTALAVAIGALYDDYVVWKTGGESFLDWAKWDQQLTDSAASVTTLKNDITALTTALNKMIGIDLSGWTLKSELQGLVDNVQSLMESLTGLTTLLDGLITMDWDKIKAGIGSIGSTALKGMNPVGLVSKGVNAAVDSVTSKTPDTPTARPSWWPEWLGGPGEYRDIDKQKPLAPGNVPSRQAAQNVTVTAPVTATINIQQQPGENGDALASRVVSALKKQQQPAFDPRNLLITGGAK